MKVRLTEDQKQEARRLIAASGGFSIGMFDEAIFRWVSTREDVEPGQFVSLVVSYNVACLRYVDWLAARYRSARSVARRRGRRPAELAAKTGEAVAGRPSR